MEQYSSSMRCDIKTVRYMKEEGLEIKEKAMTSAGNAGV
jgi:hypothetical protein